MNRSAPPYSLPPRARALLVTGSFLASSLLVHLAVMTPDPLPEWLALCALVFVPFSVALLELRWRAWLAFVALCAALGWLTLTIGGRPLLYAPSIVIPAALCGFFGRTLVAGRRPLITSVALAARPATPDYLLRYSRALTQLWTALFAAMSLWDLALAVFAPHAAWTFMANCGNYVVIGVAVGGEYLFRRLRFRDYAHPGFAEYLKIVVRADPRGMHGR